MSFELECQEVSKGGRIVESHILPVLFYTINEADRAAKAIAKSYTSFGYDEAGQFWWAIDHNRRRLRFIVSAD